MTKRANTKTMIKGFYSSGNKSATHAALAKHCGVSRSAISMLVKRKSLGGLSKWQLARYVVEFYNKQISTIANLFLDNYLINMCLELRHSLHFTAKILAAK